MSVAANAAGLHHRHPTGNPTRRRLIGTLALLLLLAAAGGGWYYHQWAIDRLQAQAQAQQQLLARQLKGVRQRAAKALGRVAGEVGTLQARVDRLTAVSGALADRLGLDKQLLVAMVPPAGGPQPLPPAQASLRELLFQVEEMTNRLEIQQNQLDLLESLAVNQHIASEALISGAPVVGEGAWLSSPYGLRQDPFTHQVAMHHGIDFAGRIGMSIVATGAGVISWAGERPGYGILVEITHPGGWITRYAHAASALVALGDVVGKGQPIALMGNSGRSTGPHVHYEVLKRGRSLNPRAFVYRRSG